MHYSIRYLLTTLVTIMLLTYPLVGGRGIQDAQLIVEVTAIITLMIFFITQSHYNFLSKPQWLFILLVIITPLIYLIPLPSSLWESISGRELYVQIAHWLTHNNLEDINKKLSLIPYETEHAFFALLPALAIFLVVVSSPRKTVKFILYVALVIAIGEAILAIIQYGKNDDYFYFGIPRLRENTSHGTYPNPDHLSTFMFIMLPFSIALLTYNVRSIMHTRNEKNKHQKVILIACYFFTTLLLLTASFFTGSRAGIVLTFLAFILSYIVLTRYAKIKEKLIGVSLVSISAIGFLYFMGASSAVSRLITENPFIDGRWQIFSNTYSGIKTFFPFGSGPGTFPDIYRLFQPIEQRGFINHAHNDYLELIFDTGLLGIMIIISFFILLIQQYKQTPTARRHSFRYIQAISSISLLLFLLHSTVEFNLHDNMNLLFFGLLAGIVFHSIDYKNESIKSLTNHLNK